MGRAHKYAGSRLSAQTSLPPARVLELGAASAAVATGNRWDGKSETHLAASTTSGDLYEVRSGFGSTFTQLDFSLRVTPDGDRHEVSTVITWYRTQQHVIAGFIPFGTKTMLGHHVYLQFVQDLAERLRAADPSATVAVYKGVERIVSADGRAAAPASAAVSRACAGCGTHAYDDDLYCGGCGTLLPTTAPETTGTVR